MAGVALAIIFAAVTLGWRLDKAVEAICDALRARDSDTHR